MNKVILLSIVLYSFCFAQQQPFGSKITGSSDVISDAILIQNGFVLDSAVVNFNKDYDGTKYQFEYYGDGKLKSDIFSKGTVDQEIVNGRVKTIWLPGRNDYFYNEKGKIDSVIYELWKDTAWVKVNIIHYSYDNDENLLSRVYSDSGKILITDINKYDSSGNPIYNEHVLVYLNDTTNTTREYDSQNRLTKVIIRTGPYGHYSYDQKLYQYDSSGNINCLVFSIFDFQTNAIDTEYKSPNYYFEFDNSGKLQKEIWYDSYNLDTTNGEVSPLKYDDYNRIQELYNGDQFFHYDADGNLDTLQVIHSGYGYLVNRAALIDSYGNKISFPNYSGKNVFYYSKRFTGVEKSQFVDKTFKLLQNYPNPFNPTTTISFDLPSRSLVSLKIFDILGRKVATIINSQVLSAGDYSKQWNASDFSSGIYFYQLKAGTFTQTKKLILLR